MSLNFSDFLISESDFEFFKSLPADEKIYFLYDLLCEQSYGSGSSTNDEVFAEIEVDESEYSISPENQLEDGTLTNIDDIAIQYQKHLGGKFKRVFDKFDDLDFLMINNFFILNSISLGLLLEEVKKFVDSGYIIRKVSISENSLQIFQHMEYCIVYELLGRIPPYSMN